MPDQPVPSDQPTNAPSFPGGPALPYQVALNKAFDKLTSEVLIFLLAYTILVVAVLFLREHIPHTFAILLYLIPLLGILAYGWLRKKTIVRDPAAAGIRVRALLVGGKGQVFGVKGPGSVQGEHGHVNVAAGVVRGDGQVVGIDQSPKLSGGAQHLLEIFDRLDEEGRAKLVASALRLLEKSK